MSERAEESALVAAAQAGDRSAIEQLVERYQDSIYRFGRKMCGGGDDTLDVVQDTLVTAISKIGDFRGEASFTSWVYAIARSHCSRKRRRSALAPLVAGEQDDTTASLPDTAPLQDDRLARMQVAAAVEEAIGALSPMYREVIVLRDVEGLPAAEVGDALGITVEAVKSRLHRARNMVRERLGGFAPSAEGAPPTPRVGCPNVAEMLSKHLEGELTGDECARMEAHVASCPDCDGECAQLRRALGVCREAGREAAPPAVRAQIRQAVERLLASRASAPR